MGVVRSIRLLVRRIGEGILIELRAVRSLFRECEVFDRVGSCKEMLGEM